MIFFVGPDVCDDDKGAQRVSDGWIKALGTQANSEFAWHGAHTKVTSAAPVCIHFTENCLHMLFLPFNTSPSASSLFFNKLEIKTAAHAGFHGRSDKAQPREEKWVSGAHHTPAIWKQRVLRRTPCPRTEAELSETLMPSLPARDSLLVGQPTTLLRDLVNFLFKLQRYVYVWTQKQPTN